MTASAAFILVVTICLHLQDTRFILPATAVFCVALGVICVALARKTVFAGKDGR